MREPASPSIVKPIAFSLVAGLAAWGVWLVADMLLAGTMFEDVSLVVKFAAVFLVLTLFEKLYGRLEGPAGH